MGAKYKVWDLSFCEVFDVLGHHAHRDEMEVEGAGRSMCKAL